MNPVWQLQVFGAAELQASGAARPSLPLKRNDAAWLAYLALNPGAPSLRVATLVWPQASESDALNSLRQRVFRLRKATGARLVDMAQSLVLAPDLALCEARPAAALAQEPNAWDSELLAGLEFDAEPEFAAWLAATRKADADRRSDALAGLAAAAEEAGELARALRYAQRLLADNPVSEHAHRRLMRLHYLRADNAAAVAAFEHCEQTLKAELGLRPSAETVQLLQTIEQGRQAAPAVLRPVPASLLRPPRLVGRDAALMQLRLAERDALLPVLVGEAGMGKTRLLQELLAGRDDAIQVQARPGDAAVPYAALGRWMGALTTRFSLAPSDMPALAGLASGTGRESVPTTPQQLQAALVARLQAAQRRGLRLLAADDLHFADAASLEALLALTQSEALAGLRWVLAHRPLANGTAESALLAPLHESPQARWLVLPPLDEPQLHELVSSLDVAAFEPAALAAALARHTGGNPLFVIETLRASLNTPGSSSLPRPQALEHLIDQRLQRLSKPALTLARVAAVAVPDFSIDLAERVLGRPAIELADAWQELEAAQVLLGEAFAHDLVHDGMRRITPAAIRARTHRQVAGFLAERGAEPARVAHHWWAGGAAREAGVAFRQAAQRARVAARAREEAALLDQAATAFDRAEDAETAWQVRLDRVAALLQAGSVEPALALCTELQDGLPEHAGNAARRAQALARQAMTLMWAGRAALADAAAQQALALAEVDDADVGVSAVSVLAISAAMRGDNAAALQLMQPWADRVEQVREPLVQTSFFGNFTNVLLQANRSAQALPVAQRHLALARRHALGGEQVTALMNLSALHARRGELAQAIAHAREADRLMTDSGAAPTLMHWNRSTLAFLLCGEGQFTEALALFEAALAAFGGELHNPALLAMTQDSAARAWLTLGQFARAQALLREPSPPQLQLRRQSLRALALQATGQRAEPQWQAALEQALEQAPVGDPVRIAAEIQWSASAEPADALARLTALRQRAEEGEYHPLAARAAALRLPHLQALGRVDELALQVPLVELAAQRVRGPHVYPPELLLLCAQAWRHLQQPARWQACLDAALHWVHQVALPQVPAAFAESFLYRNEINLKLRRLAAERAA